jgi:hypothetical protein
MAKSPAIPRALKDATRGLRFTSEIDSPVTAFAWPTGPVTVSGVRAQAGSNADGPVKQISLAELMRAVPSSARGEYFQLLVALVDHLSGVKVFKVGTTRSTAYVVGRTAEGHRAGVKTELVET